MFRRYPYWGWLLASLALWCIAGYDFHKHSEAMQPAQMAQVVNKDLAHRQAAFIEFYKQEDIVRKLFNDSLSSQEAQRINDLPFYIFSYDHDTLQYWNTNIVIAVCNDSAISRPIIIHNDKGIFIESCMRPAFLDSSKRLVVLFPIVINYPLENDYLKSHFLASEYIPVKTKVISTNAAATSGYPIFFKENETVGYLRFNPLDIQKWPPNIPFVLVLIAALMATISWIQLMILYATHNKKPWAGFAATLVIIIALRLLLFFFGLPFNLDQLPFFSPQLYAYNKYISSFGDLFINTLCVLWIVLFMVRHTPYRTYFANVKNTQTRYIVSAVLIIALYVYAYLFVSFIRSLVLDSNISFDVNHFYTINFYTILGLFLIATVTGISCLVLFIFNLQLTTLLKNNRQKYLIVALGGAVLLLCSGKRADGFYWVVLGWLILCSWLLDRRKLALVADIFAPHMIFWAVYVCIFCTVVLQYFNQAKEHEARRAFVEQRLSPHRDNEMEYAFDKIAKNIARDKTIKDFFLKPAAATRKIVSQRFETQYLNGPISKYQSKVYLFDDKRKGLFNRDSVNYNSLLNEQNELVATNAPSLFYKESILDRPYYLSYIPIYADSANKLIGYVVIDLDQKKQIAEAVYPELLQPTANKASAQENEYSYAVYVNDKLITQANDFPFSTTLTNDTLHDQGYTFVDKNDVSELYYKIGDKRTIVVAYTHVQWIELVSLFSYLFFVQICLALFIFFYRFYLSYTVTLSGKFVNFTLRNRIRYSMLAIVIISFTIIAFLTAWFFTKRSEDANDDKIASAMRTAKQSVQDYLKQEGAYDASKVFDTVSKSSRFKFFITTLAAGQKIDINIFSDNGILYNSSDDDIYNRGLLSHVMRPDAYHKLNDEGKSIVVQTEKVGDLSYLSAYEPLRDEHGITLGYINIPLFASEKDLNLQISNIVVTLINLYAFIFLLSSLISIILTRWITNSFNVITRQFSRLNLQRNERITWEYNDEIGTLVAEYNKMIVKVEENAAMLAQSERETAWREMAKQVAHEIKNPLTPMKLNIQYLQQAMKNDNPNIKQLTNKVSESIIEQIDNLSYIASEFSNFAKMPEARPEELELYELLSKAVELYQTETHLHVTINNTSGNLYVFSDRSQLLRVFTNLLENAKQAIPAERTGQINVSLTTDKNDALIVIADNGDGIPTDVVAKIFQPYFTTKTSGTGLGLAMTRKILEFWKGSISFETEEGKGTVFYIRLPLIVHEA